MDFETLSFDAKVVAGSLFGAKTSVTFHMRESRPSPRAQAALDELVRADVIREYREYHDKRAITYRPTRSLMHAFQWIAAQIENGGREDFNFPLTERIPAPPAKRRAR